MPSMFAALYSDGFAIFKPTSGGTVDIDNHFIEFSPSS
jgi:hypothetical protein